MAKKLYVGNIPHALSNDELQNVFAEYGTVVSASIIMDKYTNRSKGFGFVEMSSDEEAQAAINGLNGTEVGGRPLTVNEARPKTDRPERSGGGGGFKGGRREGGFDRDRENSRGGFGGKRRY